MPLKAGSYILEFMVDTGVVPMPTYAGTLTVDATAPPLLTGTIQVPKVVNKGYSEEFTGTQADSLDGLTTTFTFSTKTGTTKLDAYGMTILCGTEKKIMAGTNITNPTGLPGGDPTEDACWLATHSGAGDGDDDDDDKRGKKQYGR